MGFLSQNSFITRHSVKLFLRADSAISDCCFILYLKVTGICLSQWSLSLILWYVMLCYVMLWYMVGSRRLMPPDALQPKVYCTNPGLQSFLLASTGVSTWDPSSERRNYLGEKWPVISTESCDFHAYTFGFFYMPKICDVGQTALLPFRRKACWGFFRPEKNPRTWVTKASTLPLDHRSR